MWRALLLRRAISKDRSIPPNKNESSSGLLQGSIVVSSAPSFSSRAASTYRECRWCRHRLCSLLSYLLHVLIPVVRPWQASRPLCSLSRVTLTSRGKRRRSSTLYSDATTCRHLPTASGCRIARDSIWKLYAAILLGLSVSSHKYRLHVHLRDGRLVGLAHVAREDDIHDGYFIPKGSIVIPNNWWVSKLSYFRIRTLLSTYSRLSLVGGTIEILTRTPIRTDSPPNASSAQESSSTHASTSSATDAGEYPIYIIKHCLFSLLVHARH